VEELAAKERAKPGYCCQVRDFVVGRHGYGSIKFLGETDMRGLDLESIMEFNIREVIV
jgi:nuclear pore complex protein Nup98-Nup96